MPTLSTDSVASAAIRRTVADLLAEARERTLLLVAAATDDDLLRQHDALMSPLVWDLGHIAHFEALWLTRNLDGPIEFVEMPGLYNPFENPRAVRGALALPGRAEALALMAEVRRQVLERLETADFEAGNPLLEQGYAYRMVAQHEYQHNETMLQALQLKTDRPYTAPRRWEAPVSAGPDAPVPGALVRFPGGEVTLGTDDRSAAYDNERPRHRRALAPFWIEQTPVTNAQYQAFIAAGGYHQPRWWSDAGRQWLAQSAAEAPQFWFRRAGEWWTRSMDREFPVPGNHPVCHVCYYEAEAYARWAGRRLPTEPEWEAAATWDPTTGIARRFPWGDQPADRHLANLDQLLFGTAPVGAYPANRSPIGCWGMIGDVWEWTAGGFAAYPDFTAFPYREYSEVFFGSDYQVLRGGSWATRPGAVRGTFRNWDYPIRRQIFSGFRCAADD